MKELKLRYWDKDNEKMIYAYEPDEQGKREYYPFVVDIGFSSWDKSWLSEPMLYIGKQDRNGKDIYDGDIVRILYTDWISKSEDDPRSLEEYLISKSKKARVVYSPPYFELKFPADNWGDDRYGSITPGTHGWIEVIGNIYENPELIK